MQLHGRFLCYKEGKTKIKEIVKIIKQKYPNWNKNKYYKKQSKIYKLTCRIFYSNNMLLINLYNAIRIGIKGNK